MSITMKLNEFLKWYKNLNIPLGILNTLNKIIIFFRSNLFGKTIIHVIGDSHVASFRNKKNFFVHHIGPATMYGLGKKKSSTNSIKKIKRILFFLDKKKNPILLTFGEIDSRIHIYSQFRRHDKKYPYIYFIRKAIKNYDKLLKYLRRKGYNFYVYGIIPASRQKNIYKKKYYANENERIKISKIFNKELKKFCLSNNYKFIDIYSKTVDKKGFIKKEFSNDESHLNFKIVPYVEENIYKNL